MVGIVCRRRSLSRRTPGCAGFARPHDLDRRALAVECLVGKVHAIARRKHVRSRGLLRAVAEPHGRPEALAAVGRARVVEPLAFAAERKPRRVIGAVGSDRQAWPVMRASIDCRVVDAHALDGTWGRGRREGQDGVVADAAGKDVAEQKDRPARLRERYGDAAALAGVVLCDAPIRERAERTVVPGIGSAAPA